MRTKEWKRQEFHSNTIKAKWRHFENSHGLFPFRGDKLKTKQIRFKFLGKFLLNLLLLISHPTKKSILVTDVNLVTERLKSPV